MPSPSLITRTQAKLRGLTQQWRNRLTGYPVHYQHPPALGPNPQNPRGRVVFCGLTQAGFGGRGKMMPQLFLPPFCAEMQAQGIAVHYVTKLSEIEALARQDTVLIHIRNEDLQLSETTIFERFGLQMHHPEQGALVAYKDKANELLSSYGVPMPAMVQKGGAQSGTVFSNEMNTSGAEVSLVTSNDDLDPNRYNTDFIDTRRDFGGRSYHTCLRLLCFGEEVLGAWVRARDVAEGSPSVHSKDTPQDAALLEHLYAELVTPNTKAFHDLNKKISAAVGPAFLAHDVLVERTTNDLYLCETNIKFDDATYLGRFLPLREDLPSLKEFFSKEIYRKSARALVAYCEKNGIYSAR